MKHYTKIPNEILSVCRFSLSARLLYCILLKYCGQKDHCWPSQNTLAKEMGYKSPRRIRSVLGELERGDMVSKKRRGFNKTNNYYVTKLFNSDGNSVSCMVRKPTSSHLGKDIPSYKGIKHPPKITYLKEKDKTNLANFEKMRKVLIKKGIIRSKAKDIRKEYESNK